MNLNLGLIGRKLGNTQIFDDDGTVRRVTAIQAGPCTILAKRTPEQNGYAALQLGFGTEREKRLTKPELGYYRKLGVTPPRVVREFRVTQELLDQVEAGRQLRLRDVFREEMFVDVSGLSKGRGYTGVMKRHNFGGAGTITHGTHEYKRHGGSIGANMTPGRVLPGVGMPGHYGDSQVTILNLRIARLIDDDDLVLVEGGVPGPRQGVVTVRGAVKKPQATPPLAEAEAEAS